MSMQRKRNTNIIELEVQIFFNSFYIDFNSTLDIEGVRLGMIYNEYCTEVRYSDYHFLS